MIKLIGGPRDGEVVDHLCVEGSAEAATCPPVFVLQVGDTMSCHKLPEPRDAGPYPPLKHSDGLMFVYKVTKDGTARLVQ